jgi:hypothetical protein
VAAAAAGNPWGAAPIPSIGHAQITSDPPGAQVKIDGRARGTTPLTVDLPYGAYNLELTLDGYQTVRRQVSIQSEAPKIPNPMASEARRGSVLIVFEGWDGASLVVDGADRGHLPVNIVLTEGVHTFTVKGASGTQTLKREVKLSSSGLTKLLLHQ